MIDKKTIAFNNLDELLTHFQPEDYPSWDHSLSKDDSAILIQSIYAKFKINKQHSKPKTDIFIFLDENADMILRLTPVDKSTVTQLYALDEKRALRISGNSDSYSVPYVYPLAHYDKYTLETIRFDDNQQMVTKGRLKYIHVPENAVQLLMV